MNLRTVVIVVLAGAFMFGVADTYFFSRGVVMPRTLELLLSLVVLVAGYLWYRQDAAARGYRTSMYLGGAIILFSLVAVPYYLYHSREAGLRQRAILRFVGLVLLAAVASALAPVAYELARAG
jgi:ABC-type uncharacterized transport system permease subunit